MPYFSGPNGIREVADPGERFQQSFQDSRRKRLLSDFFTSGQTDIGQLARIDPEAAQQIQAQQKQSGLAKLLGDAFNAPDDQRQGMLAKLIGSDPNMLGAAMKLDPRFAGSQDGTPSDIRSLQMLQGNPELLKLDRERRQAAGMVPKLVQTAQGYGWGTPGSDIQLAPMGGVAGQQQAQFGRTAPEGGAEGDAFAAKAAEVANKLLQAGVPPDQIDTIVQTMLGGNGAPLPESSPMVPAQIAQPRDQVMTPYQKASLDRADQNANMGPIPAGMRLVNGQLERMPGAPAGTAGQKPMPVGALREDLAIEDALGASEQVFSLAAKHLRRMADGSLVVGTPEAWAAKARTFTNTPTKNDINLTEMNADKTAIVNASLRLNKGVQTEGDADRAVNELMSANDHKTTLAAMKRLIEINKRAVGLQQRKRELLRSNYGGGQQQQAQPAANGGFRILPD